MPRSKQTLVAMADEIFELYQLIASLRSRQNRGQEDLSETEFLTLDVLAKDGPMTIGEVQRRIGVVPAQMSRVVRALQESGGKGYVECRINPEDRRRVDISLSESGREAHAKYRAVRLSSMNFVLEALPPEDRFEFMRMLRRIREHLESAASAASPTE